MSRAREVRAALVAVSLWALAAYGVYQTGARAAAWELAAHGRRAPAVVWSQSIEQVTTGRMSERRTSTVRRVRYAYWTPDGFIQSTAGYQGLAGTRSGAHAAGREGRIAEGDTLWVRYSARFPRLHRVE